MKLLLKPLVLLIILTLILPACTLSPAASTQTHSTLQRDTSPDVEAANIQLLTTGNTAFALDLYQTLKTPDGNLFYSPYSISLALAMTYSGARGNTENQMASTLHFDLPQETLHPSFNALDLSLTSQTQSVDDDKNFQLNIANSLWGQQDYPFLETFLDTLALNYGAGMEFADFKKAPEPSRLEINQWVKDQTESRISELIPKGAIDKDVRLVLANAIYFNAKWLYPFDPNLTQESFFYALDGSQIPVPMMRLREETQLFYIRGEDYEAVELPYIGDKVSMLIVVPDSGNFTNFENTFDLKQLETLTTNLRPSPVILSMPKFSFLATFSLVETLADMGMSDAFKPAFADFSGLDGTKDLYISAVFHQAFVAVDELGTEAAGATAVIGSVEGQSVDLIALTIDRPFLFFIRDMQTGTLLFAGRMLNPTP